MSINPWTNPTHCKFESGWIEKNWKKFSFFQLCTTLVLYWQIFIKNYFNIFHYLLLLFFFLMRLTSHSLRD